MKSQAEDMLRNHLSYGETYANVDSFDIFQIPTETGLADVDVKYSVDVRISLGTDPETGIEEYETDTEYRTETLQMKVMN